MEDIEVIREVDKSMIYVFRYIVIPERLESLMSTTERFAKSRMAYTFTAESALAADIDVAVAAAPTAAGDCDLCGAFCDLHGLLCPFKPRQDAYLGRRIAAREVRPEQRFHPP